jgi:hypothetical protein
MTHYFGIHTIYYPQILITKSVIQFSMKEEMFYIVNNVDFVYICMYVMY